MHAYRQTDRHAFDVMHTKLIDIQSHFDSCLATGNLYLRGLLSKNHDITAVAPDEIVSQITYIMVTRQFRFDYNCATYFHEEIIWY